ncbi:MAG: hypothetical protein V1725_05235 [archaeon]
MMKRGIIYTYVAFVILALITVLVFFKTSTPYTTRQEAHEYRVSSMISFINDIHDDLQRSMYISGYRAFIALEDQVARSGQFLNSTNESFLEAFYLGTINGTSTALMQNASLSDYEAKVEQLASQVNINLSLTPKQVNMLQVDPWDVMISIVYIINISDQFGVAQWNYEKEFNVTVPILDLKDPLYSVYAKGKFIVIIKQFTETPFVNLSNNDTTNLRLFLNGSYYHENPDAPSYLMRFEGNISSSPFGIESFVYLPSLDESLISRDYSIADYLYFTNTSTANDRCQVQNMHYTDDWFRIDQGHFAYYGMTGLNYTVCT